MIERNEKTLAPASIDPKSPEFRDSQRFVKVIAF